MLVEMLGIGCAPLFWHSDTHQKVPPYANCAMVVGTFHTRHPRFHALRAGISQPPRAPSSIGSCKEPRRISPARSQRGKIIKNFRRIRLIASAISGATFATYAAGAPAAPNICYGRKDDIADPRELQRFNEDFRCIDDQPGWFPKDTLKYPLQQLGAISPASQNCGFVTRTGYKNTFKDGVLVDYDADRLSELSSFQSIASDTEKLRLYQKCAAEKRAADEPPTSCLNLLD